jgi:branched-chain amino acid transport system substrate-binding protein
MRNKRYLLPAAMTLLGLAATACTSATEAGANTGAGVTEDEIRILAINDLSGPAASGGQPVQAGLDAYIKHINDNGGIDGRDVTLETADTQYDPQLAVQAYQESRTEVAAVWSYGTPTTDAIRSFAEGDNKLLLPLKGPFAEPNTFSIMNAWEVDTALLLSHVVKESPDAKIGVIYQADAMGDGIRRGVEAVAAEYGIEPVAEVTAEATSQDLTAQVTAMRRAGADHILLGMGPGGVIAATGAVASLGVDATLLNPGSGYTRSLLDLPIGQTLEEQLLVSCSYPLWDDEGPAVDEFKEALGDVEPHGSYINGWQSGIILEAILLQAVEDGDLSPDGIVEAASHTTVDMQGLTPDISYGTDIDDRTPYREGRICSAVKDEDGFKLIEDWFTSPAAEAVGLE